jgi:hypothetical protein
MRYIGGRGPTYRNLPVQAAQCVFGQQASGSIDNPREPVSKPNQNAPPDHGHNVVGGLEVPVILEHY